MGGENAVAASKAVKREGRFILGNSEKEEYRSEWS